MREDGAGDGLAVGVGEAGGGGGDFLGGGVGDGGGADFGDHFNNKRDGAILLGYLLDNRRMSNSHLYSEEDF